MLFLWDCRFLDLTEGGFQAGFGWTNGVLLWVAETYGQVLAAPRCPNLLDEPVVGSTAGGGSTSAASPVIPSLLGLAVCASVALFFS